MSSAFASNLGLLLCLAPAVVHAVEVFCPLWARWVVNWVLPFFAPGLPRPSKALTHHDQIAMLDAALDAAPKDKAPAGADYIFLMLFEQRQGALAFIAVAAGVLYGLSLPLADRHALHLVFGIMAALFALVNANHAGIPGLGHHPKGQPQRAQCRHPLRAVLGSSGDLELHRLQQLTAARFGNEPTCNAAGLTVRTQASGKLGLAASRNHNTCLELTQCEVPYLISFMAFVAFLRFCQRPKAIVQFARLTQTPF